MNKLAKLNMKLDVLTDNTELEERLTKIILDLIKIPFQKKLYVECWDKHAFKKDHKPPIVKKLDGSFSLGEGFYTTLNFEDYKRAICLSINKNVELTLIHELTHAKDFDRWSKLHFRLNGRFWKHFRDHDPHEHRVWKNQRKYLKGELHEIN